MNKLKVLFFEGNQKVAFGGGQRISLGVIEALKDYDIYLALTGKSPIFEERAQSFLKGKISLSTFASKILKSGAGSNVSSLEALINITTFPINLLRLLNYLRHNHLSSGDTIIYSATKYGHLYAFVLMLFGYQTIGHIHTMDNPSSPAFKLLKLIYSNMTKTISVSSSVCSHFGVNNSRVIYNYIESPSQTFTPDRAFHSPLRLGMLTSLHPSKGVELLAKVAENFEECELHVGGDGPLRDQLNFKNIYLHGFVENIDRFYEEFVDVLFVPTLIPEAFGLVIAEAAARGIPTFCSNIGGQREVQHLLGVPERVFNIENTRELRRIIEDLIKSPSSFSLGTKTAFTSAKNLFSRARFQQEIQGLFATIK